MTVLATGLPALSPLTTPDMSSENIRPDLREDVDLRNRLLNLDVSDVLECIISKN
jgi:hypothetical protein